jgi:hypothetical protein
MVRLCQNLFMEQLGGGLEGAFGRLANSVLISLD